MKNKQLRIIGASLLCGALPFSVAAGLISQSSSDAVVTGEDYVGGLVGYASESIIAHSHANGEVFGYSAVGGLVGMIENATVSRSHASGSVEAWEWDAGGLVGVVIDSGTIADAYANGSVVADEGSGGLVAYIEYSTITRCYAMGFVSDDSGFAGGLIGWQMDGVTIEASYWNTQTSGQSASDGGNGRTTAAMTYPYDGNTYVGWNFDAVWAADTDDSVNSGYPYLLSLSPPISYEAWAKAIHDSQQRGKNDTPAGDDIPNLLKYASGLDPLTAYGSQDVMHIADEDPAEGFSIVFYRWRSAQGARAFAEHATDLLTGDWGTHGISEELIEDDGDRETWKATAPPGTRGYMRLQAVRD